MLSTSASFTAPPSTMPSQVATPTRRGLLEDAARGVLADHRARERAEHEAGNAHEDSQHTADHGADDRAAMRAHALGAERARGELDAGRDQRDHGQRQQRAAADVAEVVDPGRHHEAAEHERDAREPGQDRADHAHRHERGRGEPEQRRGVHAPSFHYPERDVTPFFAAGWSAERMAALGALHAGLEARGELEPLLATLAPDPVYEFHPIRLQMRGDALVRRFYQQFCSRFLGLRESYALIEEWVTERLGGAGVRHRAARRRRRSSSFACSASSTRGATSSVASASTRASASFGS